MKTLIRNIIGLFKIKKRNPQECPFDVKARSCQHYNRATGRIDIDDCNDCDWYNKGIRPSKF